MAKSYKRKVFCIKTSGIKKIERFRVHGSGENRKQRERNRKISRALEGLVKMLIRNNTTIQILRDLEI